MYELDLGSRAFFCCEPGQYGVLPISGFTGICEPVDMVVASSLIATAATQDGATGAATAVVFPATTGTTTSTLANGALTTVLTTVAGSTSILTGTATQTGSGSGSASNTAGAGKAAASSSSGSVTLSKGALIAIIVCAIIVPILVLIALLVFWRKRRAEKTREGPLGGGGAPVYAAAPRPNDRNPGVAPYAGEEHGYGKSELPPSEIRQERVVEQLPQKWEGRVEMG
jgi:hypothetical protein